MSTLELIKTAVLNGELDTQIEAAANKLRDGFAQYMFRIEQRCLIAPLFCHRPDTGRLINFVCQLSPQDLDNTVFFFRPEIDTAVYAQGLIIIFR